MTANEELYIYLIYIYIYIYIYKVFSVDLSVSGVLMPSLKLIYFLEFQFAYQSKALFKDFPVGVGAIH